MAAEAHRTSRFWPVSGFLSLSILVVISILARPSYGVTELVDKVCKQTSHYTFCVDVLYANPRTPKANLYTLAYVAVVAAHSDALNTTSYISSLLNRTTAGLVSVKNLRRCEPNYCYVAEKHLQAFECLDSDLFSIIEELEDDAAGKVDDCQSGSRQEGPGPRR